MCTQYMHRFEGTEGNLTLRRLGLFHMQSRQYPELHYEEVDTEDGLIESLRSRQSLQRLVYGFEGMLRLCKSLVKE